MDIAIQARNVSYMYSSQTGFTLKSINVNVPIGSVYALIGPSGCGKTTLLKCTMGLLKPCQGTMNIFGYEPGTVESGVPGHGVGYMPQENALHSKLTVKEILQYYGRINGIPSSELKVQIKNIVQRLRLPNKRSMVSTLSGGERRRVSFAIAVFHKPRLLILDEPTVGMDPKLRVEVWNWIRNLAKIENKTVIVTTHYVEEAKADLVAFMRKGELLSETSPKALLDSLKTNSLQDVFLVLSQSQEAGYQRRESDPPREQIVADYVKPWPNSPKRSPDGPFTIPYLVGKRYLLGTLREPGAVSVMYFFQLLAVYLCYQCLGHLPKDVPLGIVTHPLAFKLNSSLAEYIPYLDDEIIDDPSLQFYNLPKIFVDFIDTIRIKVTDYEFNLDQASSDLNRAKLAGILYFPANFSTSYYLKEFSPFVGVTIHLDNETINAGRPKLIFGNLGIFFDEACRLSLELSFRKFRTHVAKLYGFYTELFREPLEIPEAIFGSLDSDRMFSNLLIISGFVVVMAYCMPLAFCCISTIYEIRDEAFVREYATGVESSQLILSRLAASFISGAPSIFIMLLFLHYVCKVNFEGSIIVGVLFLWSQMLNGIIHGLLLAHLVPDFLRCLNLSFLTAIILVCFGGNVWPLESLPYYLRPLVDLLPYASQNKAMFTLMNRGTQPFLEDLPPALFKTSVSFFGCLFYAIYVTTRK